MTCLKAWRSEVLQEIWRFELLAQQAGDVSGSLTSLHERCSTWVKCGCALGCKVAPRGSKVVGLRMTCAGLSCLTLDVFFVAYRGASTSRTACLCSCVRSLAVSKYGVLPASYQWACHSRTRRRCRVRPSRARSRSRDGSRSPRTAVIDMAEFWPWLSSAGSRCRCWSRPRALPQGLRAGKQHRPMEMRRAWSRLVTWNAVPRTCFNSASRRKALQMSDVPL
jgi:hypothetical protein